jgi:hypothetical protein
VKRILPVLALLLLAACTPPGVDPASTLPTVPADIQACFRTNGPVKVPQKALTIAEVESLWKEDRVRAVVLRKCGNRFLAWYEGLRKNWR